MPHRLSKAMHRMVGRQGLLTIAALTPVAGGVIAVLVAISSQQSAPQPPPSAAGRISVAPTTQTPPATTGPENTTTPISTPSPAPLMLAASTPATISIPAISVHSDVIALGKDSDGTLAVPQPGPNLNKVAWYDNSPTPGQPGPSVLEGHVDTIYGPSIFFRLGALKPGDKISITRADHSTAVFTVNAVRSYATHSDFPTAQVFGSDLADPTLRLITCSNFDNSTGHYVGNTVVFAHLTATTHA